MVIPYESLALECAVEVVDSEVRFHNLIVFSEEEEAEQRVSFQTIMLDTNDE